MKTEITQEIWNQISNYVSNLDWAYIITFIIISYGINHYWIKDKIKKTTKVKSKTRYRTVIVGVLYAVALYFIRGYELEKIESLFQSLVFALVFHQLIIDGIMGFIAKRMLPESVSKHIACSNNQRQNLNEQI
jgi:hypothetical protein